MAGTGPMGLGREELVETALVAAAAATESEVVWDLRWARSSSAEGNFLLHIPSEVIQEQACSWTLREAEEEVEVEEPTVAVVVVPELAAEWAEEAAAEEAARAGRLLGS